MTRFIAKSLLGLAIFTTAAVAAAAQPMAVDPNAPSPPARYANDRFGEVRAWVGIFRPTASSLYWDEHFAGYGGSASDFQNAIGGGDFIYHVDRINAFFVSVSGYGASTAESFDSAPGMSRRFSLDIVSVGVGYALFPAGTHGAVIPYLGLGGGAYTWRLHEGGVFDTVHDRPLVDDARQSDTSFGVFALAGLEIPLSRHVALLVDGRYTIAHGTVGSGFSGEGNIDLSGVQVAGGVAFHL